MNIAKGTTICWFLGPRGPFLLPLLDPSAGPFVRASLHLYTDIYDICPMNQQKTLLYAYPLTPWDCESESRMNSRTFLSQFVLFLLQSIQKHFFTNQNFKILKHFKLIRVLDFRACPIFYSIEHARCCQP